MKYKNYYKILGVSGPGATADEIKVAYRKLAKKYHPDNNKGDQKAEERFKDIGEAYQNLSSTSLRKRYNIRYYFHFMQNGFDITELPNNVKNLKNSEYVKIFIGEEPKEPEEEPLFKPGGSLNNNITIKLTIEEAFLGVVKQISYEKAPKEVQTINVKIPRGANDTSKVLLRGEGFINPQTGETGDLFINFSLLESPEYELQGIDLLKEVLVSPSDIVLGNTITVESLDGKHKLKIPNGTKDDDVLTIKEAGFISKEGKRGDLLIKIKIKMPVF